MLRAVHSPSIRAFGTERDGDHANALSFRRDGYVVVRAMYREAEIEQLANAIVVARRTAAHTEADADEQLDRDAFLWNHSPEVAAFAFDLRLGALAADLIGANGIRLIHDVALEKGPDHRATPWHRDSDFWSFDGAGALTMWIPLQETPLAMSPLRYVSGSHRDRDLRPLRRYERRSLALHRNVDSFALSVGDVAVHHCATLHGAARNRRDHVRLAYAIHLIDADARYRASFAPGHVEHDRRCGWNRLNDGDALPDDLAPLVYRRSTTNAVNAKNCDDRGAWL